mmetsp:Transcript_24147/g.37092  ORF Transcript_24147/g.37092 Transcript_24147/m.37092 type:complete len:85 (-) Transcript_24147:1816-2070(-)
MMDSATSRTLFQRRAPNLPLSVTRPMSSNISLSRRKQAYDLIKRSSEENHTRIRLSKQFSKIDQTRNIKVKDFLKTQQETISLN